MTYDYKLTKWKRLAQNFIDEHTWAESIFIYQWKTIQDVDLSPQETVLSEKISHKIRVSVISDKEPTLMIRRQSASLGVSMCSDDTYVYACLLKKPPTMGHRLA